MAFISLCNTIVPLQEGLPLLLRSPSSQASTVPSTERNSLQSASELLSSSSPMNALSALCPPSSSLSCTDPDASSVGCFRGLPGLRALTSGVNTPDVVASPSVLVHVCVRRGLSEPSPRSSALPEPVLMADPLGRGPTHYSVDGWSPNRSSQVIPPGRESTRYPIDGESLNWGSQSVLIGGSQHATQFTDPTEVLCQSIHHY